MTLYYKMQEMLLQNAADISLQNAIKVYCKMRQVLYYKMRQSYYKMQRLLQNGPSRHSSLFANSHLC